MQLEITASSKEYSKERTSVQYDAPLRTNKMKESGHIGKSRMSYAEALKNSENLVDKNEGINKAKQGKFSSKNFKSSSSIFVHNLPRQATAKDIWTFFKDKSSFKDIILPRNRDKYNVR